MVYRTFDWSCCTLISYLTKVGPDTENTNLIKKDRHKANNHRKENTMKNTKTRYGLTAENISAAVSAAFLLFGTTTIAQDRLETDKKSCSYNTTTPIIPDGNIATKDELISAQKRIKIYQDNLLDFRECLSEKEAALSTEAQDYETQKAALFARRDESIDLENKVAAEFNEAIRIYKER